MPYKDIEVLEWYRRMKQCEDWYDGDWRKPGVRESLKAESITHVVAPANHPLFTTYLEPVHQGTAYIVYRVK